MNKVALVTAVCVAHAALFFYLASGHGGGYRAKDQNARALSLSPQRLVTVVSAGVESKPAQPAMAPSIAAKAATKLKSPTLAAEVTEKSILPESPSWMRIQNRSDFLEANALDETALPDDTFEQLLGQRLPVKTNTIVLEFWIDENGRTVEVNCIEGDCSAAVAASLASLTELQFKAAIKHGLPVASRKVIQVETPSGFGL